MNFSNPEGATPIDANETLGLIPPHLTLQSELNEWEAQNILQGLQWATARRHPDLLSEKFIRDLHRHLFDQTWKWAGQFRRSDKNLGVHWSAIPEGVKNLCEDAKYWKENQTYPVTEIAVRFHHRLVSVHPFPNGNGRHSRLMADLICAEFGARRLTWSSANLMESGTERHHYLVALKAADTGNLQPLIDFASH
ncbi:MAG: mobile mystery protein B [Verrucomicrobiota bacterium]